jgi:hypothetical protein
MNRHFIHLWAVTALSVACSSETSDDTGQISATGGVPASGGAMTTGGATAGGSGGAPSGGATTTGGSGGIGGTGGEGATGGTSGGAGGFADTGGSGGAGASGGSGGSGGTGEVSNIADALEGLRVDAPCAGTPAPTAGAVCDHVVLTDGGFFKSQEVTIAGTPGTTYDVTLRIRGVVEPTNISGGTRPDTSTFQYMNMSWRSIPYTIGGTVVPEDADYAQWNISVGSPAEQYFLNDYQKVGHYIFELDYEITIPMDANTTVVLNGTDDNEREIVNYEGYAPEGVAGSMNLGQFIELSVVAVTPH